MRMMQNLKRRTTAAMALSLIIGAAAVHLSAQGQNPGTPDSQTGSPAADPALTAGVDPKTMDYDLLGSNKSGRALYALKKQTGAHAALIAAFGDLQKLLGATPTVGRGRQFNPSQRQHSRRDGLAGRGGFNPVCPRERIGGRLVATAR
jgi:hypothetical protein